MKKELLLMISIVFCFTGRAVADGYKIVGKVPGVKKAMAYLVTNSNSVTEIMDSVEVVNERFEFKGKVSGVIPTLLVLNNQSVGGLPIFLENKEYRVEVDPNLIHFSTVKGGGEAQRISDEYRNIEIKCDREINKYRAEFDKLQPNDTRFQELMELFDSVQNKARVDQENFVKKHADSYLALELLATSAQKASLNELKEGLSKFSPEMQKSFSGRNITSWIEKQEKAGVGKPAPDFTVLDPKGKSFNFYSVKAKVKLIDFWASWCKPCRAMVPKLKAIYKMYHDKGFEIVSISMDKRKSAWLKAIEEEGMPWVHGCDFKGNDSIEVPLMKAYAFWGVPYLILVDEENRIIMRATGANELPEIEKALWSILVKNVNHIRRN